MKINQNSKIRFQIILISVLGGVGFCGYLAFSMVAFSNIKLENQYARDIQYPIIQQLVSLEHEISMIRNSLSDVVELGSDLFIDDTDLLAEEFHQTASNIAGTDPSLSKDILSIENSFTNYYEGARALTLLLVQNPDDLKKYEKKATISNQRYKNLKIKINALLKSQQQEFSHSLKTVNSTIQRTHQVGIFFGVLTIVGLIFVTWMVSLNVMRLINRSDKLKKEFLSTMSHELRTPMNGISGAIQLLKTTDLNGEQSILLDAASKSFSSMKISVNDILTFSDFMSEKPKIRKKYFSLYDKLQPLLSEIKDQTKNKKLSFSVYFDDVSTLHIESDCQKILHVIRHILNNAVKFTASGAIDFHVSHRVSASLPNEGDVVITVTDSGGGVPDEQLEEIFQPFQQLDGSFRRLHQGIGLGLAMCKTISESMEGDIQFQNRDDKQGAIVTFTFPALFKIPEAEGASTATDTRESASAKREGTESDKTILVAEDNSVNQLVIQGLLKRLGYRVVLADNGQEALEKLPNNDINLVLMDCQMPVMDGFESTRNIRKLDKPYCSTPIIAVTANTMEGDRERCIDAGMNEYLKKPVDISALKKAIDEQLERMS